VDPVVIVRMDGCVNGIDQLSQAVESVAVAQVYLELGIE